MCRPGCFGRLDFEIDNLASGLGGRQQNLKLRNQGSNKAAAKLLTPASGDGRHIAMFFQKLFDFGQCRCRYRQGIEPEFKELGVAQRHFSPLDQFRR